MTTPTRRGNVPMTHAERVQRITNLIAQGKTNKEIAKELRVTRSRIDTIVRTRHLREPEELMTFGQSLSKKAE
jgi:DNA-binding NarL/FixJ family response regulator